MPSFLQKDLRSMGKTAGKISADFERQEAEARIAERARAAVNRIWHSRTHQRVRNYLNDHKIGYSKINLLEGGETKTGTASHARLEVVVKGLPPNPNTLASELLTACLKDFPTYWKPLPQKPTTADKGIMFLEAGFVTVATPSYFSYVDAKRRPSTHQESEMEQQILKERKAGQIHGFNRDAPHDESEGETKQEEGDSKDLKNSKPRPSFTKILSNSFDDIPLEPSPPRAPHSSSNLDSDPDPNYDSEFSDSEWEQVKPAASAKWDDLQPPFARRPPRDLTLTNLLRPANWTGRRFAPFSTAAKAVKDSLSTAASAASNMDPKGLEQAVEKAAVKARGIDPAAVAQNVRPWLDLPLNLAVAVVDVGVQGMGLRQAAEEVRMGQEYYRRLDERAVGMRVAEARLVEERRRERERGTERVIKQARGKEDDGESDEGFEGE